MLIVVSPVLLLVGLRAGVRLGDRYGFTPGPFVWMLSEQALLLCVVLVLAGMLVAK